jgi:hypothetical protein
LPDNRKIKTKASAPLEKPPGSLPAAILKVSRNISPAGLPSRQHPFFFIRARPLPASK